MNAVKRGRPIGSGTGIAFVNIFRKTKIDHVAFKKEIDRIRNERLLAEGAGDRIEQEGTCV